MDSFFPALGADLSAPDKWTVARVKFREDVVAALAEQLVDEWLNRQGFFTIRGVKQGVHEIDLLGIRPSKNGTHQLEAWHVEVQISFNPVSYISKLSPAQIEELGAKSKNSSKKRSSTFLEQTVAHWVLGKFKSLRKQQMREGCWPGLDWKPYLVHAKAKHPEELELIARQGIMLIEFSQVLKDLRDIEALYKGNSGTDIVDIISYFGELNAGVLS